VKQPRHDRESLVSLNPQLSTINQNVSDAPVQTKPDLKRNRRCRFGACTTSSIARACFISS